MKWYDMIIFIPARSFSLFPYSSVIIVQRERTADAIFILGGNNEQGAYDLSFIKRSCI
jgi:hypothetical protein